MSNRCYMYKVEEETNDHILLQMFESTHLILLSSQLPFKLVLFEGFDQRLGFNYFETFNPIVKPTTVQVCSYFGLKQGMGYFMCIILFSLVTWSNSSYNLARGVY